MCDYCDCRDMAPIKELSDEHERIESLAAVLRRALLATDPAALGALVALQRELGPHLAKEEAGLFAQLATRPGLTDYLAELAGDHARARAVLLAARDVAAPTALLGALDELAAHIETEEHDLFPASRLILDDFGWSEVAAAHARAAAPVG